MNDGNIWGQVRDKYIHIKDIINAQSDFVGDSALIPTAIKDLFAYWNPIQSDIQDAPMWIESPHGSFSLKEFLQLFHLHRPTSLLF